jgi:hypothetical protein
LPESATVGAACDEFVARFHHTVRTVPLMSTLSPCGEPVTLAKPCAFESVAGSLPAVSTTSNAMSPVWCVGQAGDTAPVPSAFAPAAWNTGAAVAPTAICERYIRRKPMPGP